MDVRFKPTLHYISGAAEILGSKGLILPGVTRIQTRLVPLTALGLTLVMVGAIVYQATRGEYQNIALNVMLLVASAFLVYGRWKLKPLEDRSAQAES
jgi:uncharacterized membrane protein